MRGLLRVSTALCLLALAASTAQASNGRETPKKSAPQDYLAVSVNVGANPDSREVAMAKVDLALRAGFNTLRIVMPWTYPWQNKADADALRLCSVAGPAAERNMKLFLNIIPAYRRPPTRSNQITWYDKTIGEYLQYLIGPNGCAKGLNELDIQVANEPNYDVFWPQAKAPEEYARLLVRTYKFVHQQIQKHDFDVPVKVIGGELASSHDPVGFMNRMKLQLAKMGETGPIADMFSYHCYGTNGSSLTSPEAVQAALDDLGGNMPLLCTEYAMPDPTDDQYCQAAAMVVRSGLAGFGWFRLLDDPEGLKTGLFYYDPALGQPGDQPVAKVSLAYIQTVNAAALSGRTTCG